MNNIDYDVGRCFEDIGGYSVLPKSTGSSQYPWHETDNLKSKAIGMLCQLITMAKANGSQCCIFWQKIELALVPYFDDELLYNLYLPRVYAFGLAVVVGGIGLLLNFFPWFSLWFPCQFSCFFFITVMEELSIIAHLVW